MKSIVAGHWKSTRTNWEPSWKLILLQLGTQHRLLPRNSTSTVLWSLGIWSKMKRWKSSRNGCLMSWPQIKKKRHFEVSSSLTLCNNNEQFLNQIVTVNFIQLMTGSAAGWKISSKALPKAKVAPKKGSQTLFGGPIHYSFLNPSETITSEKYAQQIDEIHWKLQGLQWALVHRKGPILLHDNAWPHVT